MVMLIVFFYPYYLLASLSSSFIFTFLIYFCVTLFRTIGAYAFFPLCLYASIVWCSYHQLDYRIIKYDCYLIHCFRHRGKISIFPARNILGTVCFDCVCVCFFFKFYCWVYVRFFGSFFCQFVCDIGFFWPGKHLASNIHEIKNANTIEIVYVLFIYMFALNNVL